MAVKKPIVLNSNGQFELLQAGDTLFGAGGGGSISLTEVEIDFGSTLISSKKFTITDAGIVSTNIILIFTSPNPGTGRIGNDWEVEMPFFNAVAGTGDFTLNVVFPHKVKGKRKIYYQII